ncbi:hypothetical protein 10S9_13 [uncultured Caudovirales phage]|uniref:Uncharacterized protein n=1 Tax=uncultured Caudovirales phage TaxID=2100421 RepID=A0A2H4JAB9_9CAUD|nr:hypothetical protein 10S9_13 [uncultured Caudovirales phage]
MNMIIRQKDIDALRDKLKIGDYVTYRTEAIDIKLGYVQKEDNDAVIVRKLPHTVIVEYMAKRGRNMVPVRTAITYREIFFQRRGLIY